jgi:hypothetical protein
MNPDPSQTLPLSLVIPVVNEEENLRPLWSAIGEALDRLGLPYEVVLVDDGSRRLPSRIANWVVSGGGGTR